MRMGRRDTVCASAKAVKCSRGLSLTAAASHVHSAAKTEKRYTTWPPSMAALQILERDGPVRWWPSRRRHRGPAGHNDQTASAALPWKGRVSSTSLRVADDTRSTVLQLL